MITTIITVLSIAIGLTANSYKLYKQVDVSHEVKPWTAPWYKHCAERYRTFDRETGLFVAHGGKKTFCRMIRREVRYERE